MAPQFRFYQLSVWRKAIDYADAIYDATNGFPAQERFGLTSQLRRAAVSIASNIAEGSSRASDRDYIRFIEIAYGSTMETVSQLCISQRRQFITDSQFEALTIAADELARMLSGLKKNLNTPK
jgi:four helix bundle protein